MLIAELKGKLPSKLESSEDVLTSNVFSFFKYSNRAIYLKRFLSQIGINVSGDNLEKAEFQFWPCYFDGTEPDVVIIVGKYYILIEAKYRSGFGVESCDTEAQLKREMNGGLRVANEMGKELILVAITADSTFKKWGKGVQSDVINSRCFKWLNWQTVAKVLVELLEKQSEFIDNLPLTVIRRFDCILEKTKEAVVQTDKELNCVMVPEQFRQRRNSYRALLR